MPFDATIGAPSVSADSETSMPSGSRTAPLELTRTPRTSRLRESLQTTSHASPFDATLGAACVAAGLTATGTSVAISGEITGSRTAGNADVERTLAGTTSAISPSSYRAGIGVWRPAASIHVPWP